MFPQSRLCLRAVSSGASRLTAAAPLRTPSEIQTTTHRLPGLAAPALSVIQLRFFNSVKYSSKLEYYSATDVKLPRKLHELKYTLEGHDRPLTLLLTWLMAKDKHIRKYVKFYNDLGIDVLNVKFTPIDIMTPKSNAQRVVDQFLNFLHHYPADSPMLIHGFSVGGYLCAASMIDMEKYPEKHGHLKDRFIGQIWDSVVDTGGLPIGVSRAVTDTVKLQQMIQKTLEWYLRFRYDTATVFYERASVQFHKNYLETPGLFFVSSSDPISPPEMVLGAHDAWRNLGYPVYAKCWNDTKHVSHYMTHRKEYEEHVIKFLENIGLKLPIRTTVTPVERKFDFKLIKPQQPAPILTLSR